MLATVKAYPDQITPVATGACVWGPDKETAIETDGYGSGTGTKAVVVARCQ